MKDIKIILIGLIILGLIAATVATHNDYQAQELNKNVLLTLDYLALEHWSRGVGEPIDNILEVALNNGISTISLSEREIYIEDERVYGFFELDPDTYAFTGKELMNLVDRDRYFSGIEEINPHFIYIYCKNQSKGLTLLDSASMKYGETRVKQLVSKKGIALVLKNNPSYPVNGLGFSLDIIKNLQKKGFSVIPRFVNSGYKQGDQILLESYMRIILKQTNPSVLIFAGGNGVIGYPYGDMAAKNNLKITQSFLFSGDGSDNLPIYAKIEKANLAGSNQLANLLDYNITRVHSIGAKEWEGRYDHLRAPKVNNAIRRYAQAVDDRSIRVLYLRPFSQSTDFNNAYFSRLNNKLTGLGYYINENPTPTTADNQLPLWQMLCLGLGVISAILLLIVSYVEMQAKYINILLVLISITVISLSVLSPQTRILLQKLIALCAALVFPTSAVLNLAASVNDNYSKNKFVATVMAFGMTFLYSLIGALYVHASLSTARFQTAIEVFPMVKVALLLPIVAVWVGYLLKGPNIIDRARELLANEIRFYQALLVGLFALGLTYMLLRSGNNPIFAISALELKVRALLQQTLIARPRFKEFAIGYPVLMLAIYLRFNSNNDQELSSLLYAIGTIGLVSLINTFAHIHKPIKVAFMTTANGLWIGFVLGSCLIFGIKVFLNLISKERYKKREEIQITVTDN